MENPAILEELYGAMCRSSEPSDSTYGTAIGNPNIDLNAMDVEYTTKLYGNDGQGIISVSEVNKSLAKNPAKPAVGEWVLFNAVGPNVGHLPADRGRPDGTSWWDYGNRFTNYIIYGPYTSIGPGAYEYGFEITFEMPAPINSYDFTLFESNAAEKYGQIIPGSPAISNYKALWNSEFNVRGTLNAIIFTSFAVDHSVPLAEFRLKNHLNLPIRDSRGNVIRPGYHGSYKIIVHRFGYRKIS